MALRRKEQGARAVLPSSQSPRRVFLGLVVAAGVRESLWPPDGAPRVPQAFSALAMACSADGFELGMCGAAHVSCFLPSCPFPQPSANRYPSAVWREGPSPLELAPAPNPPAVHPGARPATPMAHWAGVLRVVRATGLHFSGTFSISLPAFTPLSLKGKTIHTFPSHTHSLPGSAQGRDLTGPLTPPLSPDHSPSLRVPNRDAYLRPLREHAHVFYS